MDDEVTVPIERLLEHRAWVRALAGAIVRDPSRADDIAQDVWVQALRSPPKSGHSLRAWFARVVRHRISNARRADDRRGARETAAARADESPPADEAVAAVEEHARVVAAVAALAEPYRTAIVLRYFEGLGVAEIAARVGAPQETVRTRLRRALDRLRAELSRDGGLRRTGWLAMLPIPRDDVAGRGSRPPVAPAATTGGGVAVAITGKLVAGVAALAAGFAGLAWYFTEAGTDVGGSHPAGVHDVGAADSAATRQRVSSSGPGTVEADDAVRAPVDLSSCDRERDVFGFVTDTAGAPVAGARVTIVHRPWERLSGRTQDAARDAADGASTHAAADGSFSLRLQQGDRVSLRAEAPGYAVTELRKVSAGERVTVVLGAPAVLIVRVIDAEGGAAAGASVVCVPSSGSEARFRAEVVADASGTARIEGLSSRADVLIVATSPAGAIARGTMRMDDRRTATAELRLMRTRTIVGAVTDGATGAPVAGAEIGAEWHRRGVVKSDASGRFEFPSWTGGGEFQLCAWAPGFAPEFVRVGTADEVRLALRRGIVVTGRVVSPDGRPVEGAAVTAEGWRFAANAEVFSAGSARTGADGRFAIRDLRADVEHNVTVFPPGCARILRVVTAASPDAGDLVTEPGRFIRGRVVAADGSPIARRPVTLVTSATGDEFIGRPSEDAVTDDLGRFSFRDVCRGPAILRSNAGGSIPLRADIVVGDAEPPEVVLRAPAAQRIRVAVHDERGAPVGDAFVALADEEDPGRARSGARTDVSGHATIEIEEKSAARWVWATGPEHSELGAASMSPIPADDSVVTLQLPAIRRIRCTVVAPDGTAAPGREFRLVTDGRVRAVARSGPDGALDLRVPAKGTTIAELRPTLGAADATGAVLDAVIDVTRAPERGFVITLRIATRAGTITVLVLGTDDAPAADATVLWMTGSTGVTAPATTGRDGRVALTGLPTAAGELRVFAPAARLTASGAPTSAVVGPPPVTTRPDGQEIVVRLVRAKWITARLTGRTPTAAAPSMVMLRSHDRLVTSSFAPGSAGAFAVIYPADETGPFSVEVSGLRDGKHVRIGAASDVPDEARDVTITAPE